MSGCSPVKPGGATISWSDVHTCDADEPAAMQRRWMPMRYDQIDRGTFAGRFRELSVDGVIMVSERQNRTVLKRQYTPTGSCSVSAIRQISETGRCELDALDSRTTAYMPGDRDYEILMPPSDIVFLQLDQARVMEVAETLGCPIPGNGGESLFMNQTGGDTVVNLVDTVFASLEACAPDERGEVVPGYVGHLVMSHAVEVMSGMSSRMVPASLANAHRITRAARALVEVAEEPLTVIDLCRELKVSRATLQRCFEHLYGIPPLMYLRTQRLNAARRALIAARGTATTVTSIAMRWGFFHLARFANDYRAQFGELPSTTLSFTGAAGRWHANSSAAFTGPG